MIPTITGLPGSQTSPPWTHASSPPYCRSRAMASLHVAEKLSALWCECPSSSSSQYKHSLFAGCVRGTFVPSFTTLTAFVPNSVYFSLGVLLSPSGPLTFPDIMESVFPRLPCCCCHPETFLSKMKFISTPTQSFFLRSLLFDEYQRSPHASGQSFGGLVRLPNTLSQLLMGSVESVFMCFCIWLLLSTRDRSALWWNHGPC